jgi:hypothetical protein
MWKQRSLSNGTQAQIAMIEVRPIIGGPESWPALSKTASMMAIKPLLASFYGKIHPPKMEGTR